jgi:hypothetical protein
MRKRTWIPLVIVFAVVTALLAAVYLRGKAPPEAARLLPESDAIVYVHLKPLRLATHFDQTPLPRSADFQHFIDATGIEPERDLDEVAFALHRMPDAKGPNGPVAYSEVFVGRFDGERLSRYLASVAQTRETYAGRDIYCIPMEGRVLRVAQLGYDTIGASNMPTAEQIHSMLDRARAPAIGTAGSSLLEARYRDVPLLSQAWGIGNIGLPFAGDSAGHLAVMGFDVPLAADTDLVASLRYTGSVKLRIEEFAPDEAAAQRTLEAMNGVLGLIRGLSAVQPVGSAADAAMRNILASVELTQKKDRAILNASASLAEVKALASAGTAASVQAEPSENLQAAPGNAGASK